MSEKQSKANVEGSKGLISNFLKLYFKTFVESGSETITPKLHELYHLPELTEHFSNLSLADTKKYERFHQFHINKNESNHSRLNVEFSLMKKYLQSLDFNFEEDSIDFSKSKLSSGRIEVLKQKYGYFLRAGDFKIVKSATIRKIVFTVGKVFIYQQSDAQGLPVFVSVDRLLFQNELIIVAKRFITNSFNEKKFIYSVSPSETLVRFDCSERSMVSYKEVSYFPGISSVNKTFVLPDEVLITS